MTITLVERYNPAWPQWFEQIKCLLGDDVHRASIRIEHVGSTSIPGMTAKPVIDIIIVIRTGDWLLMKSLLEALGYEYRGDQGIPLREVFRLKEDEESTSAIPFHHMYVCPEESPELRKEVAFRDYMRQHPLECERLSALKWSLAVQYDNDRQLYIAGKDAMVKEITRKALAWIEKRRD